MQIIIERFEMKRICLVLRKKGWFLTSGMGNGRKVQLRFIERTEEETRKLLISSNLAEILDGLYGE